jgi:hypothetical protein
MSEATPADPVHPARLRTLEAIARRAAGQPEAVRLLLQQKLPADLAQVARVAQAPQLPTPPLRVREPKREAQAGTPLAQLNLHIRATEAARAEAPLPGETHDPDELVNARAFRRAWARGRTLEQLEQALVRKPANAGPLNSHALVLQMLSLMRDLSPEYLRRFVGTVETLQWLERAGDKLPRETRKPASAAKRATPARAKK